MNKLVYRSQRFFKRNASTILTCVGGAGVIATSVMAVKATPKALALLEKAKEEKGEELTKLETVKVAAPVYIPAAAVGVSTLVCIFGANALNKRQQAALVSAYALIDSSYKDYKKKVSDLYGDEGESRIREEIAKDKYEAQDIDFSGEENNQLFYDEFSSRYFESTLAKVQRAEYELNRDLVMRDYAYLNDWYEHLGLEPLDYGEDVGWTPGGNLDRYWQSWMDFSHSKVVMDDGLECIIITMFSEPYIGFDDYS